MMEKKRNFIEFTPFLGALAASVVTVVLYFAVLKQNNAIRIVQVCIAPLIPLIIPVLNRIFKIRIPFALNVYIAVQTVLCLDCAAALGFYSIHGFDKFLHTSFGFLGALCMFVLMLYLDGEKMKPFGFFAVLTLSVLGLAAVWEIWEFFSDAVLGTSCQGWQLAQATLESDVTLKEYFSHYNPMKDTMWDIIVTFFGTMIFYLMLLIDRYTGFHICKSIYRQVKGGLPSEQDKKIETSVQVK